VTQQVNLLQAPFRRERQAFSAATMLRVAAAVVAGVALLYGISLWQVTSQRTDLKQVEAQQATLAKRVEELSRKIKPAQKSRNLEEEIVRAERELTQLGGVQEALKDRVLANTRGYSEYFVALARQHVAGVWLTGFDIAGAGERMRLQGRTVEPAAVLRYVQRLSAEQPLAGVEFQVFQMSRPEKDKDSKQPAPYVEFLIRTAARSGEAATAPSLSRGPRLDPIAEAATAPSLSRGPRLDPIGATAETAKP
jgi:outer membrane murein-binding lipoprotein Lpp